MAKAPLAHGWLYVPGSWTVGRAGELTSRSKFLVTAFGRAMMFCGTAVSGGPHEERLIDDIIRHRNYTPLARPVAEESDAVLVSFGLSLQQIIRVVSRTRPLSIQRID